MSALNIRKELRPGYDICRVLKGNWQLTPDHLKIAPMRSEGDILDHLYKFVQNGFTTFDVADIYTGAEELLGKFLFKYKNDIQVGLLPAVQIHTKYVPDIDTLQNLKLRDTEAIIDRSLQRLGVERLDLVQFHWWDLAVERYVDVAGYLQELQKKGKIRYIGVTNFDMASLQKLLTADIEIMSAQVQYSVLDRRPEKEFAGLCLKNNISLLCYGSLAGGFLSDKYLDQPKPDFLANRSLTKYTLIIEEFGGWDLYQQVLTVLNQIGKTHGLSISEIAVLYTLSRPAVAGAIIGARNSDYIHSLTKIVDHVDMPVDWSKLENLLAQSLGPKGDIYHLERYKSDHKSIMKYKLNKEE